MLKELISQSTKPRPAIHTKYIFTSTLVTQKTNAKESKLLRVGIQLYTGPALREFEARGARGVSYEIKFLPENKLTYSTAHNQLIKIRWFASADQSCEPDRFATSIQESIIMAFKESKFALLHCDTSYAAYDSELQVLF